MARKTPGSVVSRFFVKLEYTDEDGRQRETTLRAKTKAQAQQLKRNAVKKWPKAKGVINEHLYVRVRYTKGGRAREFMRAIDSRSEAEDKITKLREELKAGRDPSKVKTRKTFSELADHYREKVLVEPEFRHGVQIAGMRSRKSALSEVKCLESHFGEWYLSDIRTPDVKDYKLLRLRTPTRGDEGRYRREHDIKPTTPLTTANYAQIQSTRTLAAVHREIARLRTMLHLAKDKGWLETDRNEEPISFKGIIETKKERKRARVLSRTEETQLLALCTERRAHLRPIVIAAIDTGCRRGELLAIKWRNVDFEEGQIFVDGRTTKTLEPRTLPMTIRLREELLRLKEKSPGPDFLVFGITDNFQTSWDSVRAATQIEDLHFHDLRATCISRWLLAGIPLAVVQKLAGHRDGSKVTYQHYFKVGAESAREAAAVLDRFNAQTQKERSPSEIEMIN